MAQVSFVEGEQTFTITTTTDSNDQTTIEVKVEATNPAEFEIETTFNNPAIICCSTPKRRP